MPAKEEVAAVYREAHAAIREALDGIDDASYRKVPGGDEWAIANILAHVIESQEFWLSQIERLLKEPGATIGRIDEVSRRSRERAIEDGSRAPFADLWSRLERVTIAGQRRLQELAEDGLLRSGTQHTSSGVRLASVGDLFLYIAGHIEEHAQQIVNMRAKLSAP